jgi:hypothetical protein
MITLINVKNTRQLRSNRRLSFKMIRIKDIWIRKICRVTVKAPHINYDRRAFRNKIAADPII